jgi:AcrR family transcriptional regulator
MKKTQTIKSLGKTRADARRRSSNDSSRHRIVEAARAHFFNHGFRSVTMDDLAAELGISKKTLYAHFASKTALLQAVLADKFASVGSTLERITREHPHDFPAALHQLLAGMHRELEEIKPPFVRDMRLKAPHVFKIIERRRAQLIQQYFGKLFVEGQRTGMVRRDVSAKLMIEILLGAVQAIMNPQKIEELGLAPKTAFIGIIKVVLEGALIRKGMES